MHRPERTIGNDYSIESTMFDYFALTISTICIGLLLYGVIKGNPYYNFVENLDKEQYPFRSLYVAGFSLNNTSLFRLRGKTARELKKHATILYGEVYSEFYSTLAWAQFLSLSLMAVSILLIFGALAGSSSAIIFVIISGLAVAAFWNISILKMKEALDKRRDDCVSEFPAMISKLSLLINTGMVLRDAWKFIAERNDGELYKLMRISVEHMNNGESDIYAIYKFGVLSDAPEIKKFTSAIIQGMEKGSKDLTEFLTSQSSELLSTKKQMALQKGEIAAGKLIIPLGITFVGIIMIIVSAAMQSMSF